MTCRVLLVAPVQSGLSWFPHVFHNVISNARVNYTTLGLVLRRTVRSGMLQLPR